jgi:hypothetical protein
MMEQLPFPEAGKVMRHWQDPTLTGSSDWHMDADEMIQNLRPRVEEEEPFGSALSGRPRWSSKLPRWENLFPYPGRGSPTMSVFRISTLPRLADGEGWFDKLIEEVTDDAEPMPPTPVLDEAKRIVRQLRQHLPPDTDVYPMDGGKIAVELYGDSGHGFLLVCEPGGSALCIVTVNGVSRRARYESSDTLPDGFVLEGLKDVRPSEFAVWPV